MIALKLEPKQSTIKDVKRLIDVRKMADLPDFDSSFKLEKVFSRAVPIQILEPIRFPDPILENRHRYRSDTDPIPILFLSG